MERFPITLKNDEAVETFLAEAKAKDPENNRELRQLDLSVKEFRLHDHCHRNFTRGFTKSSRENFRKEKNVCSIVPFLFLDALRGFPIHGGHQDVYCSPYEIYALMESANKILTIPSTRLFPFCHICLKMSSVDSIKIYPHFCCFSCCFVVSVFYFVIQLFSILCRKPPNQCTRKGNFVRASRITTTEEAASLIREGIKEQCTIDPEKNSRLPKLSELQQLSVSDSVKLFLQSMAHQTMKKVVVLLNLSLLYDQ